MVLLIWYDHVFTLQMNSQAYCSCLFTTVIEMSVQKYTYVKFTGMQLLRSEFQKNSGLYIPADQHDRRSEPNIASAPLAARPSAVRGGAFCTRLRGPRCTRSSTAHLPSSHLTIYIHAIKIDRN
jgi:hypothetical protein